MFDTVKLTASNVMIDSHVHDSLVNMVTKHNINLDKATGEVIVHIHTRLSVYRSSNTTKEAEL
ncbi:hypothetical protein D3C74_219390 [compost metagenome]